MLLVVKVYLFAMVLSLKRSNEMHRKVTRYRMCSSAIFETSRYKSCIAKIRSLRLLEKKLKEWAYAFTIKDPRPLSRVRSSRTRPARRHRGTLAIRSQCISKGLLKCGKTVETIAKWFDFYRLTYRNQKRSEHVFRLCSLTHETGKQQALGKHHYDR